MTTCRTSILGPFNLELSVIAAERSPDEVMGIEAGAEGNSAAYLDAKVGEVSRALAPLKALKSVSKNT
ncbi:hypothetical protein BGZ80_002405, partial [Entomortierella chlamydospora]